MVTRTSSNRGNANVMWRMLGLAKPLAGWMVLAVVCGVAGFCCATGIPVLASWAALVACGASAAAPSLATIVAALAAMAVARGVLHYIEQRCNHYIAFKLLAHIRDLVFAALRHLCPAKLAGADRGSLVSTVTADVELLEVFYAHTISPICIAVIMAAIMGVFLGFIHMRLALIALVSYVLVGVCIPVAVSRASGSNGRVSRDQAAALSGFVLDGLRGLGEVLQFGAGERRLAELDRKSAELLATQKLLRGVAGQGQAAATGAIMVLSCFQMVEALMLATSGAITPEGAVLATVATFSSFGPFVALANLGSTLQGTLAAGNRVLDILDERPQVEEVADANGAHPSFEGIAAQGVSFSYGAVSGTAASEGELAGDALAGDSVPVQVDHEAASELILDNVSVSVSSGEIVAIQGRSGSGKSTLCRLLMRFWDPGLGCVALSGTDVREVATSCLRNSEAFVEQDTHLFHDSIRDNLRIAKPDATDAELEAACNAASVHDFIMSLPKGYDTMVGELGDTLSGGERQRLGLARAFLHDAPLLLLDEPTSNLDSLNEGRILQALDEQRGKRAVVLISHRPSTMAIADKTYSMNSGRVS